VKRRKRPPPPRSPDNGSCAPTLYQRGTERRPREDYTVGTQQCSPPPVSHEGRGSRIDEERKEELGFRGAILIGERFRRGGKRARRFHLPARARLGHPRARQSPPNPPAAHRDQPSSRETNPSGVSLRPGGGAPFSCARPGCGLGQVHKQRALQPEGAAGLLGPPSQTRP